MMTQGGSSVELELVCCCCECNRGTTVDDESARVPLVAYKSRMSDPLFSFGSLSHLDDSLDITLGEMNRPRVL